jgi:hypothetical protein
MLILQMVALPIHTCILEHIHTYFRARLPVYLAHGRTYSNTYAYIHIHVHTYLFEPPAPAYFVHVYIYTCIRMYMHTYFLEARVRAATCPLIHTYIHVYVYTCTRPSLRLECEQPPVLSYIYTYIHVYLYTCTRTSLRLECEQPLVNLAHGHPVGRQGSEAVRHDANKRLSRPNRLCAEAEQTHYRR